MAKNITINGTDFTEYFTKIGYSVAYESVNGNNGRTMLDGHRTEDELDVKAIVVLPCMPLNEEQVRTLLSAVYLMPYCVVNFFNPRKGIYETISAMRSVSSQGYQGESVNGLEYWTGTVITLREQ